MHAMCPRTEKNVDVYSWVEYFRFLAIKAPLFSCLEKAVPQHSLFPGLFHYIREI